MSAESGVFSILAGDADLAAALGVTPDLLPTRVLRAGNAVDIPDLCVVVRWEETPLFGNLALKQFTLRGHDRGRSYSRIEAALDAAKATLSAVAHTNGVTQVDWRGRSADLVDDGYKTLTKYDTYVVAAGLATRGE